MRSPSHTAPPMLLSDPLSRYRSHGLPTGDGSEGHLSPARSRLLRYGNPIEAPRGAAPALPREAPPHVLPLPSRRGPRLLIQRALADPALYAQVTPSLPKSRRSPGPDAASGADTLPFSEVIVPTGGSRPGGSAQSAARSHIRPLPVFPTLDPLLWTSCNAWSFWSSR